MKQQLRIGIFLAVALVIMAVFIFIVGDLGRFFRKPGYAVYVSLETVAGLDPSATVRMSGIGSGKDFSRPQ
jgi:ABC-type transporter Mla subunit MlaD